MNGVSVWNESYCHGRWPNNRGVTLLQVDPIHCTISQITTFDTNHMTNNAEAMDIYLNRISSGSVLVGVTGDEPTSSLTPVCNTLRAMGVDVYDVNKWGNFVFVIQKGHMYKTAMRKSRHNHMQQSRLTVHLSGKIRQACTINCQHVCCTENCRYRPVVF